MKNHTAIWSALTVLLLAGLACSLFTPDLPEPPQPPQIELPAPGEITRQPELDHAAATLQAALTQAPRPSREPKITLPPGKLDPTGDEQSRAAIETYARDVLGIEIQVQAGKGLAGEFEIPLVTETSVDTAVNLAGVTYFGFWKDGAASLSVGSGSVSGELYADVQDGSLGVYSLRLPQAMPQNTQDALALIQATFPGLQGFDFTVNENYQDGSFAFSTAKADDYEIRGGEFTLTGSMSTAGVSAGRRQGVITVWVIVSSGALTAPFE